MSHFIPSFLSSVPLSKRDSFKASQEEILPSRARGCFLLEGVKLMIIRHLFPSQFASFYLERDEYDATLRFEKGSRRTMRSLILALVWQGGVRAHHPFLCSSLSFLPMK